MPRQKELRSGPSELSAGFDSGFPAAALTGSDWPDAAELDCFAAVEAVGFGCPWAADSDCPEAAVAGSV